MAEATQDELKELRESLPALEEELEDATETYRGDQSEENKAWYAEATRKVRYTRWRLRGGDPETAQRGAPVDLESQE